VITADKNFAFKLWAKLLWLLLTANTELVNVKFNGIIADPYDARFSHNTA